MSSPERELSRERAKHSHSSSDLNNFHVPMWDSSDPHRDPPPLPLNPGRTTPNSSPTRPNTSTNVAAAAQALVERARESLTSPYTSNTGYNRSPEKAPAKTPQNKRIQDLQNTIKDSKAGHDPPSEKIATRPRTPSNTREALSGSPEGRSSRGESEPPPATEKGMNRSASLRATKRPPPRPLIGQSTPPSATMLALQNMDVTDKDAPLGDITNWSTPTQPHLTTSHNFESIHSQMLRLTHIANTLQNEMAALSRRSKDNATDLVSLKEATKTRDEDIRKSLRELVTSSRASESGLLTAPSQIVSRPSSALGSTAGLHEHRPPHSPNFSKSISLPRIPPVHGLEELDRAGSPFCVEGTASVAMLEKIIREMGTKEGQERLISQLSELMNRSSKESSETAKKVAELVDFIRDTSTSKALVRHKDRRSSGFSDATSIDDIQRDIVRHNGKRHNSSIPLSTPQPNFEPSTTSDEFAKLLQKIKESVVQGGATTGEVKFLLRDLRGEVLGMGRELGRKLEKLEDPRNQSQARPGVNREELESIVHDGLADLKDQMDQVIQTRRRESAGSALSRNTLDNNDVQQVVRYALAERGLDQNQALQPHSGFDHESIITTIRDSLENFQPDIQVETTGLERDEILQCLKEGLEDYQSSRALTEHQGISREEVMDAIQEGLQGFTPPAPANDNVEIKEDVITAFRECLDNFQPESQDHIKSRSGQFFKADVLDAIREGLSDFKKDGAREIEIHPDDLFQAVKAGLDNMSNPFGAYGEQVLNSLHEIVEGMRVEFKQYSAANGRDTEQVLDALKDGLEDLRAEIEAYVDRAQDVTGKDEIIDTLKIELGNLQSNFEDVASRHSKGDASSTKSSELVEYIKAEFEQLHDAVSQGRQDDSSHDHKEEILRAVSRGFAEIKSTSNGVGLDDSAEDRLEAMKEEFEQLREAILNGSVSSKDEILDSMQESFSNVHERLAGMGSFQSSPSEVIEVIKEEFAMLKDSQAAPVLHSGRSGESMDNIDSIRETLSEIRVQLSADQNEAANEHLGLIKEELESFREAIGGSLMLSAPGADKDAIIQGIKEEVENIRIHGNRGEADADFEGLESIRSELEHLRQSISSSIVPSGNSQANEEVLETLRSGLDELKSQLSSQIVLPESKTQIGNEALDALTDNLNNMRTDIAKMLNKPVDMTVSYEILDVLKEGLSGIHADFDKIKSGESDIVLAAAPNKAGEQMRSGAETVSPDSLNKSDIQGVEVLLAQLQIKIEAMDQTLQSVPLGSSGASSHQSTNSPVSKDDLSVIESALKTIQGSVEELSKRPKESQSSVGDASKEDLEAIEVLLHNTKAKIDDQVLPSFESTATREQIDTLEAVMRMTNETVDSLSGKFDTNHSAKDDLEALALMIHEAHTSLKDIRERLESQDQGDKVSRSDVDEIGKACSDIKDKLESMPSGEELPGKDDMEALADMLHEFQESHNQLKEAYEGDIAITAKAFDDRKGEASAIMEQIQELRGAVEESRDVLKSRMKRSNEDVRALDEILQGIEEKFDEIPDPEENISQLKEAIDHEFEKASSSLEAIKSGQETLSSSILERADVQRGEIISELSQKFNAHFESIMSRHDEHQQASDKAAEMMAVKSSQQEEVLAGTRAMAEELKLTIDTLGSSVATIGPTLEETTNRMSDDAKTVFNRVDEMHNKLDDGVAESKGDHQLTREDIAKSLSAIGNIQEELSAHNTKFLESINTLVSLVEHQTKISEESTTKSSDGLKAHFDEGLKRLPVPQIEGPTVQPPPIEKYDDTELRKKLDDILARGVSVPLDDSTLRGKLDELLSKTSSGRNQEKLDEIQQQVMATSSEVAAFVAFQTKMLNAEHENKEKEADQAALDLSKCLNEKESIESDVTGLRETRNMVAKEVEGLKAERDSLATQKMHLSADVSSLETALRIRREELQMMDTRADALERRIIEGVMDHSRALLMAKTRPAPANMNLKRVSSNRSSATDRTTTTSTPSVVHSGLGIALKSRNDRPRSQQSSSASSRRIASLSQITHNVPSGGKSLTAAPRPREGLGNLKRSQSVKTHAMRKTSWNPSSHGSLAGFDKENDVVSEESDDEKDGDTHARPGSAGGETVSTARTPGTEISSSYGTGSEYTYGTGSYFTGSETNTERRTSYGSTVRSNVANMTSLDDSIHEDDEHEEDGSGTGADEGNNDADGSRVEGRDRAASSAGQSAEAEAPLQIAIPSATLYGKPESHDGRPNGYDSGIGSDLPTADLSAANFGGSDYFKPIQEE